MTAANTCACGKPTAGAHLCDRCARTFSYAIWHTLEYYLELPTVVRKETRFGDPSGPGSIGKTQPLPVDGRFLDNHRIITHEDGTTEVVGKGSKLRRDTETVVAKWADRVAAARAPLPGPACEHPCLHVSCANIHRSRDFQPPDTRTVLALGAYLARNLQWILRQPRCTDMLTEFLALERRLSRMIDSPPTTWYAGKCSAAIPTDNDTDDEQLCETELYARVDKGFIDCPGCKTRHDVGERREILLAEAQNILVTATEAAGALIAWTDYDGSETKLVDRIRKWRDRDKLEVIDVTTLLGQDRHLYRLGDIQALLIETAQAQQAKRVGA